MRFDQLISAAPVFFIGIASLTSWRSFFKSFPLPLRQFALLWTLVFMAEIAGHILREQNIKNHWIYNIINIIIYLTLPYIYQQVLQSTTIKKIINWYYGCYLLFILTNSIFIQGLQNIQTLNIVVGGGFMLFLAAAYLWQLNNSEDNDKVTNDPFFWLSVGFIVYFGGSIPFLGMLNYLWNTSPKFTTFYYVYFCNSFSIFLNIMIVIGFLCRIKLQK